MLIRLGHSPDPDDAFMFWALDAGAVDTRGFAFEAVHADIATLNAWAREAKLEVTALSLAAYPLVQDRYALLPHGASIGSGYGPVVVAREELTPAELGDAEVAVPGRTTTAFLTARLALGEFRYREVPFERVLEEVAAGRADAGLVIHEGQLTYADAGLRKVLDLGEWWLLETGLPLPLGVNAVRRDVERVEELSAVLLDSIRAGLEHRDEAMSYALRFGRGIEHDVADAGLRKVLDLGEWWLLETGLPLPLGVNAVRRDVERVEELSAVLLDSIRAGLEHRDEAMRYALRFGRGIEHDVADRFVEMYVNALTCDYGEEGRQAVAELLRRGEAIGAFPEPVRLDFVG